MQFVHQESLRQTGQQEQERGGRACPDELAPLDAQPVRHAASLPSLGRPQRRRRRRRQRQLPPPDAAAAVPTGPAPARFSFSRSLCLISDLQVKAEAVPEFGAGRNRFLLFFSFNRRRQKTMEKRRRRRGCNNAPSFKIENSASMLSQCVWILHIPYRPHAG